MYPQVTTVLHHSPVVCQHNPASKLHAENVGFDSVLPQFTCVSAHKEVSLDSILLQFSGRSQDQTRVNNVMPQSSGMSAQSNQQTAYRKSQIQQCLAAVQRHVSTQGSQSSQYLAAVQQRVAGSSKSDHCYPTVQWCVSAIQPANCIQKSQIRQCLTAVQRHVSTQESVLTVSCRSSVAGCRIKKLPMVRHSPVACQRNPTSKLHTRRSESTGLAAVQRHVSTQGSRS